MDYADYICGASAGDNTTRNRPCHQEHVCDDVVALNNHILNEDACDYRTHFTIDGELALNDAISTRPPGAQLLGREWLGYDETRQRGVAQFNARPDFTNRHGTIQGGFLAAMLDSAAGITALAALPPNLSVVTVLLTTRFLKPARAGTITAMSRLTKHDEREIVVEIDLVDAKDVRVAEGTAHFRVIKR